MTALRGSWIGSRSGLALSNAYNDVVNFCTRAWFACRTKFF